MINRCACGKQPSIEVVRLIGYIINCECGAQTYPTSQSTEATIEEWNNRHVDLCNKLLDKTK